LLSLVSTPKNVPDLGIGKHSNKLEFTNLRCSLSGIKPSVIGFNRLVFAFLQNIDMLKKLIMLLSRTVFWLETLELF
jgi:hypothetical protein